MVPTQNDFAPSIFQNPLSTTQVGCFCCVYKSASCVSHGVFQLPCGSLVWPEDAVPRLRGSATEGHEVNAAAGPSQAYRRGNLNWHAHGKLGCQQSSTFLLSILFLSVRCSMRDRETNWWHVTETKSTPCLWIGEETEARMGKLW